LEKQLLTTDYLNICDSDSSYTLNYAELLSASQVEAYVKHNILGTGGSTFFFSWSVIITLKDIFTVFMFDISDNGQD
jgi:hypothetical protein